MDDPLTLRRLRAFLLALAAALLAGTLAELVLVGHADGPVQSVPFVLCGLGLLAVAAVWLRPGRGSALVLRAVMAALTNYLDCRIVG